MTTGLKKVTDDMKTKNRADRSGAVPSAPPSSSAGAAKGEMLQLDATPLKATSLRVHEYGPQNRA